MLPEVACSSSAVLTELSRGLRQIGPRLGLLWVLMAYFCKDERALSEKFRSSGTELYGSCPLCLQKFFILIQYKFILIQLLTFTCMLHVSTYIQTFLRNVNTKTLRRKIQ